MTPRKETVPAKIVDLDPTLDPVPATIVSDRRNLFWPKLAILGLILMMLFFIINNYIQSAQNSDALHRANADREKLIDTVDAQTELIKTLQLAIQKQNKELKSAGLTTIDIPGVSSTTIYVTPSPKPSPKPSSSPHPHSTPHPTHNPSPSPSPSPTQQIKNTICKLTGICTLFDLIKLFIF